MIRAIIFDYDGVIVNTDPFNFFALNESLKREGINLNEGAYRQYFAGTTLRDGAASYLRSLKRIELLDAVIEHKKSYDAEYAHRIEPYNDSLILIARLRSHIPLHLATGARRSLVDVALNRFHLDEVFTTTLTADDYIHGKPNPEIYEKAAQLIRFPKNDLLVIEDSPVGIEAAKSAGLLCLAVTHTHPRYELLRADVVVDTLDSIESHIEISNRMHKGLERKG